jgi:hypothetical protein
MLEDAGLFSAFVTPSEPAAAPLRPHAHRLGHRGRLRERAAISLAALPDYELLELRLARSLPRQPRGAA